jgi:ABC-type sulfate transport system permease component
VSSMSASGKSSGKTIIAIVLVVLAVLLVIAAIIFFVEPAHSLPSFMGKITHPPATLTRANATRPLHGAAALVAAIVCLVAAFFVNRSNKPAVDGSRDPDAVDARR